ncbi:MAG: pyruvate, phosphate dikinase [Candidatus Poribacteria bacterium]|nr:pyruvate, phosphate dikinase [Candidatus Poribacteria bacterium]
MSHSKYVYFFGEGKADGSAEMRALLGGKGANLAEMTNLGIPVPPGYTISTEVCKFYYANQKTYPDGLEQQIDENLGKLESAMGTKFADPENPLLVSVRSGAAISMPGMMDTILNLGLNDDTVKGLIAKSGSERFAYDAYRRFVQMFGNVVLNVKHDTFEHLLEAKKEAKGVELDTELGAGDLGELILEFKTAVRRATGADFPEDVRRQLDMARDAVFESSNNERAVIYRRLNNIPDNQGQTAVNVQAMVFGNLGGNSATGVAFTRNPSTGENRFYGEFLVNAQGEDVVAGIRTPLPIDDLRTILPDAYNQLVETAGRLETHYRDMQDLEFTIQDGRLFMLQTRAGKRTGHAAVRVAVEMVNEGLIDKRTAVMRVPPNDLDQLLHSMIDPNSTVDVIAKGLPASPGAAVGKVVFTADRAEELAHEGEDVILVRSETSPEDIGGMYAAAGILTSRGGMTSHAAVVARGMGKSCVAGCSAIVVNPANKEFHVNTQQFEEGDYITLNGSTGEVIAGAVELIEPTLSREFATLMEWSDEFRKLGVRTNADTPSDTKKAREFGAEGIGLCRTEHMFFEGDQIDAMREMILARNEKGRKRALAKLLPYQLEDFIGIFEAIDGYPVTIRTLDPPLHEFLPHTDEEIYALADKTGSSPELLRKQVESLRETNPMLGHRGCRLGIVYPEITEMQARAIFEAAVDASKRGIKVIPEIMIPLVGHVKELVLQRQIVIDTAEAVFNGSGVRVDYLIGTMIELPRAALTGNEIAEAAEFFSFGTNDLTQTTFGLSRDDIGKFLEHYVESDIFEGDPFQILDQEGVGQLVQIGTERGRQTRPNLKVGICGEHGGEPSSVEFCHRLGLDYVSCSPFRVPIARLAAAQAAIKDEA